VRLSELFAPGKNSLVIYNMMFPRWSEDQRAGAPGGKTAELPLVEQPCPSCTSVVDGLEGAAFHLAERINLVVIAKTSPDRLGTYAQERGWRIAKVKKMPGRAWGDPASISATQRGVRNARPSIKSAEHGGIGWAADRFLNVPRAYWFLPPRQV
jgi:predicted dithiol-disulfide oxidoreductase (DUF899 family)